MSAFSIVAAKLPSVERAFDAAALDDAPGRKICPHVRTVGVQDVRPPVFATKNCKISSYTETINIKKFSLNWQNRKLVSKLIVHISIQGRFVFIVLEPEQFCHHMIYPLSNISYMFKLRCYKSA